MKFEKFEHLGIKLTDSNSNCPSCPTGSCNGSYTAEINGTQEELDIHISKIMRIDNCGRPDCNYLYQIMVYKEGNQMPIAFDFTSEMEAVEHLRLHYVGFRCSS